MTSIADMEAMKRHGKINKVNAVGVLRMAAESIAAAQRSALVI